MKTNCNIIKDLLPSYIDGICSQESQQLIQEHMAECKNCRKLFEQVQLELTASDTHQTKEVDYFKKIKSNVFRKNVTICIIVGLLVLLQLYCNWNPYRFSSDLFMYINYLFPVINAGILFALLPDYAEHEVPAKLKFTILGIEFAAMTYIFVLLLYTGQSILKGSIPFGMEAQQIGPFLGIQLHVLTIGFVIAFAVTLFLSIRKKSICPALHFVPLGGISLMFEFLQFLYGLTPGFHIQQIIRPYLALAGEVILLIGIYILLFKPRYALRGEA